MKTWFSIFSAVLAAGLIVFYISENRQDEIRRDMHELEKWKRDSDEAIAQIRDLLGQIPDDYIVRRLDICHSTGSLLLQIAPRGADTSNLKSAISSAASLRDSWASVVRARGEAVQREAEQRREERDSQTMKQSEDRRRRAEEALKRSGKGP